MYKSNSYQNGTAACLSAHRDYRSCFDISSDNKKPRPGRDVEICLTSSSCLEEDRNKITLNYPPKNLIKMRGHIAEPLDIGIDAIPVE